MKNCLLTEVGKKVFNEKTRNFLMKKTLFLIFGLAVSVTALSFLITSSMKTSQDVRMKAGTLANVATLSFVPSATQIYKDGTVSVTVKMNPATKPVKAVDVIVKYDRSILELTAVTPDTSSSFKSFLPFTDGGTGFDAAELIALGNSTGSFEFGAVAYNTTTGAETTAVTTAVNLATLTFKAKSVGQTTLSFDFDAAREGQTAETTDSNVVTEQNGVVEDILGTASPVTIKVVDVPTVTPVPTSTPTPTATPIPTNTPRPTATPVPTCETACSSWSGAVCGKEDCGGTGGADCAWNQVCQTRSCGASAPAGCATARCASSAACPSPTPIPTNTPVPTMAPTKASLKIRLLIQGLWDSNYTKSSVLPIEVLYRLNNGDVQSQMMAVTPVASGPDGRRIYEGLLVNLEPGSYEFLAEARSYLPRNWGKVVLVVGENTLEVATVEKMLLGGDAVDDEKINTYDSGVVVKDYQKNPDSLADFNFDGKVSTLDFSYIVANYIKTGESWSL